MERAEARRLQPHYIETFFLERRTGELDREAQLSALPPVVLGGLVVVPLALLASMTGRMLTLSAPSDTHDWAARARAIVMEVERNLGFEPRDREHEKLGYDVESRDVRTGRLRFLEVKGGMRKRSKSRRTRYSIRSTRPRTSSSRSSSFCRRIDTGCTTFGVRSAASPILV